MEGEGTAGRLFPDTDFGVRSALDAEATYAKFFSHEKDAWDSHGVNVFGLEVVWTSSGDTPAQRIAFDQWNASRSGIVNEAAYQDVAARAASGHATSSDAGVLTSAVKHGVFPMRPHPSNARRFPAMPTIVETDEAGTRVLKSKPQCSDPPAKSSIGFPRRRRSVVLVVRRDESLAAPVLCVRDKQGRLTDVKSSQEQRVHGES